MTTLNLKNVEAAMENYTNAEFELYEIEEAKKQEMAPIEKKYEKPLEKATRTLEQQRINQHKAVADTIRNNPDWHTSMELFNIAMEFEWKEGNDPFFFDDNERYVTKAILETNPFNTDLIMPQGSHYCFGYGDYRAHILVPQVKIDASTRDEELQDFANALESYMDSMREYVGPKTRGAHTAAQAPIFSYPSSSHGCYVIVSEEKGAYRIAITRYGSYSDITPKDMSLFDVLKIVRDKYGYSDKKNIHPDSDDDDW